MKLYARTAGTNEGGAFAKLLVVLLIFGVSASGAMFFYVKSTEPLAFGEVVVDVNDALSDDLAARLTLEPNGQIYIATIVRNAGRFPLILEGLGAVDGTTQLPYLPVEMRLGDGTTPDPDAGTVFTPTRLDPGTGIGILIVFAANPGLLCELFTEEQGSGFEYRTITVRFSIYGVEESQTLGFDEPLFTVGRPTQEACDRVAQG